MPGYESPELIAQRRLVDAMAILNNQVDLRGYPYRHLGLVSERGRGPERVMYAIAAAEVLDRFGWELVNIAEFFNGSAVYAFMRRRGQ